LSWRSLVLVLVLALGLVLVPVVLGLVLVPVVLLVLLVLLTLVAGSRPLLTCGVCVDAPSDRARQHVCLKDTSHHAHFHPPPMVVVLPSCGLGLPARGWWTGVVFGRQPYKHHHALRVRREALGRVSDTVFDLEANANMPTKGALARAAKPVQPSCWRTAAIDRYCCCCCFCCCCGCGCCCCSGGGGCAELMLMLLRLLLWLLLLLCCCCNHCFTTAAALAAAWPRVCHDGDGF
jgi:hypothetical protein